MGDQPFTESVINMGQNTQEGHADTPIILISPIFCPFSENTPGPTIASIKEREGKKRLVFGAIEGHEAVRQNALSLTQMRTIIGDLVMARNKAGDTALGYMDGLALFSAEDQQDLPDDLHPNAAGYVRIGERFADIAFGNGMFTRLS